MKITEIINLLESPEQVRSQIVQKIQTINDESDLKDVLVHANKYSYKQDVGALATAKGYKDSISQVILQAVGKLDAPSDQVKGFLNKLATDGILDEKVLLTPRNIHNLDQFINKDYLPIFRAIKLELFEKIAGKMGEMGDVGKGEYLLSILSPHIVRRGAPGDLRIESSNVELKAGLNGRLGPAGSQALAGRFDEFVNTLQRLNIWPNNVPPPRPTLFNPQLNMSQFSNFFGNDPKRVKKALYTMLKMHYPSVDVNSIVNEVLNGAVIDGDKLKQQMLLVSYAVYQSAKKFDGVLITDYGINRYLYINTPENAALAAPLLKVAFPSWTDMQSNCIKVTLRSK